MLVSPVPHQMMPYMNVGTLSRTELQLLNQLHCRRKRRHRTIFTDEQLEALENLFQETKYPDVGTREQLARKVHLREEKVEVGSGPRRGAPSPAKSAPHPLQPGVLGSPWVSRLFGNIPGAARRLREGALGPGSRMKIRKRERAPFCRRARGVPPLPSASPGRGVGGARARRGARL